MIKQVQLNLNPAAAADDDQIKKIAATLAGVNILDVTSFRIIKRSVDARKQNIRINISVEIVTGNDNPGHKIGPFVLKDVSGSHEVIIIGAGPAGLFAALRLIELGLRPVILERGKDVSPRKKDIAKISREQLLNPESNYCFGVGGAGAYSDGKLYTRSRKRGDNIRVLELLCWHGANENILYEAHPHLGTDKLPGIISAIRKSITDAGGIFLIEKKVADLLIEGDSIKGVITSDNDKYLSKQVILATGHSARDIYELLQKHRIEMEIKSFAVGVRVEHPQDLIDSIQYHGNSRGEFLTFSFV